jgi:hypothetical protein
MMLQVIDQVTYLDRSHGVFLPGTDSPEALGSNILSNIALEPDRTGPVKAQVRRPVTSRAMMVFMISEVPP